MSDNWTIVIPADPMALPTPEHAAAAVELARRMFPGAESIEVTQTPTPTVIDPGSNWEGVRCPACDADLEEWWSGAVDAAARTEFTNLDVITPCCSAATSINDLHYPWPMGFARWRLEAMNPDLGRLTDEQVLDFQSALGMPVRLVYQHL